MTHDPLDWSVFIAFVVVTMTIIGVVTVSIINGQSLWCLAAIPLATSTGCVAIFTWRNVIRAV